MSLNVIHLRKLLNILYSEPNKRISAIRSDIRADLAKEAGAQTSGGDFYGPFCKFVSPASRRLSNLVE
jgi:hypothetical protein